MSEGKGLLGAITADAKRAKIIGVVMIVAGVLALLAPFVAGVSAMMAMGSMLLIGGVLQCVLAFQAGAFGRGLPVLLVGVLTLAAGGLMIARPVSALAGMTILLAGYFIATGVLEAMAGFSAKPEPGWGWLLFGGVISIVLGVMLWRQFPLSGIWAVGTLIGVRMLFGGFTIFSIGSAVGQGAARLSGRG